MFIRRALQLYLFLFIYTVRPQVSFLDYMCYIPLFMSMHDNIVDNPLDMSDQKYSVPPRTRPVSAQRDMNPLGFHLSKNSSLQMRQQAKDLMEGKLKDSDISPERAEKLYKYAKLPEIKGHHRTGSAGSSKSSGSSVEKMDLIF
ncbi:hypothetical protein ElyMa_001155200 [Elysia marginata]|uniref:Uncharacterized protein n=1 Tax=Elysia marginata TaxID=1093978 RepID=A0AAV4I0G3_9GAST|nr:hypothetical protein ElyMa_001155200 [Elysia marginata]